MTLRKVVATTAVAAALVVMAAGCGSDSKDDSGAKESGPGVPEACKQAPVTVEMFPVGESAEEPSSFEVRRAVALRTPILPQAIAGDGSGLAALQSKAEITPLARYSLYLSDFVIDTDDLTGKDLGVITPPEGSTLGVVTLVPATEGGLSSGDVVVPGDLGYEPWHELQPLGLQVLPASTATPTESDTEPAAEVETETETEGRAELLVLNDKQLCVDFDITVRGDGEIMYSAKGTVMAPLLRSAPAYFIN